MFLTGKYSILKKMKYVSDQQGILDRYIKEASAWAEHLQKTKDTIKAGAENKKKGSCAVLGSGWLLDVPVEFLYTTFENVYLFDVLHPTQIKHKMHKIKNVHLVEQDITGGAIDSFYKSVQMHKSHKKRIEPGQFDIKGFEYKIEFDYVISVNILNQLDTLLIDYIEKYNLYSAEELSGLRKTIQQAHYNSLPESKTCLITDYEEIVIAQNGTAESVKPLIYIQLPEEKICDRWQWNFDHNDYRAGKNVVFNVAALNI